MGDEEFSEICFVTSYKNFISDHNSIIIRVPINGNNFTDEFKAKITFDSESHLKKKALEEECSDTSSKCLDSSMEAGSSQSMTSSSSGMEVDPSFTRRFRNVDMSSCWLNACLQLTLAALDYLPSLDFLTSELGTELRKL